jgi:hypothetical protein
VSSAVSTDALSSGSTVATFTSAGNVGIGTTSVGSNLHIKPADDSTFTSGLRVERHDTSGQYGLFSYAGGAASITAVETTASNPVIRFQRSTNGSTTTESARIDASGRLLVGTSTARSNVREGSDNETPKIQFESATNDYSEAGLSVINNSSSGFAPQIWLGRSASDSIGGNALVSSGRIGSISFNAADGTNFIQGARIQADIDGTSGSGDLPTRLVFSTTADGASSPTERMRIGSNGDITFSTHSDAAGVTGEMLMGPSKFYGMYFEVSIDGSGFPDGLIQGPNSSLTLRCGGTGGVYLGNGSTSWTSVSDERAKTNLQPIENGLNKVSTLRAFTGEFKGDESGTRRPFLIAQDVEKVLPEAVDSQNPEQLGLSYSDVIPLLVAALKESKERIETLEAKVAALEAA